MHLDQTASASRVIKLMHPFDQTKVYKKDVVKVNGIIKSWLFESPWIKLRFNDVYNDGKRLESEMVLNTVPVSFYSIHPCGGDGIHVLRKFGGEEPVPVPYANVKV